MPHLFSVHYNVNVYMQARRLGDSWKAFSGERDISRINIFSSSKHFNLRADTRDYSFFLLLLLLYFFSKRSFEFLTFLSLLEKWMCFTRERDVTCWRSLSLSLLSFRSCVPTCYFWLNLAVECLLEDLKGWRHASYFRRCTSVYTTPGDGMSQVLREFLRMSQE